MPWDTGCRKHFKKATDKFNLPVYMACQQLTELTLGKEV